MAQEEAEEETNTTCSWEEAEDRVLIKALTAVQEELSPYIWRDSRYDKKLYDHVKFTHKELLAAVPLFQKRRDILIALHRETGPKDGFYKSLSWQKARYKVLTENKATCNCCGAKGKGVCLHVDHIKPRSKYPELELDIDNLQALCEDCNMGKSNTDETDWRK